MTTAHSAATKGRIAEPETANQTVGMPGTDKARGTA
jgi:hypothetical protein